MEQLERTRRYLMRIRSIYEGVPVREGGRDYYTDDVHTFFIHCYHIRDWALALSTVEIEEEYVDGYIRSHIELRVCADLCNAAKHCELKRTRLESQPHVTKILRTPDRRVPHGQEQYRFSVLADGELFDALELAEACVVLWDEFVAELQHAR